MRFRAFLIETTPQKNPPHYAAGITIFAPKELYCLQRARHANRERRNIMEVWEIILIIAYLVLGYWAAGQTIYADKIKLILKPKTFYAEGNTKTVIRDIGKNTDKEMF